MRMSDKGIAALIKWEGFKTKAYKDTAGLWTIGVGHLINLETEKSLLTAKLTPAEVHALLKNDLLIYEKEVLRVIKKPLTQNQFDALVSLCFNLGGPKFSRSTVVRLAKDNPDNQAIGDAFLMWNKSGGKVTDGLVTRRKEEVDVYFKSKYP